MNSAEQVTASESGAPGCEAAGATVGFDYSIGSKLMRYLSTRDPRPSPATFSFTEVLLAGLAADGGLYVPDRLPGLGTAELTSYAGLPYAELSARVVSPFSGETFTANELRRLTAAAYSGFIGPRSCHWFSSTSGCGCSSCFMGRRLLSRISRCNSSD